MKKIITYMLFFLYISAIIKTTKTFCLMANTGIHSDAQAIDYCKNHTNTYVVIVWPKGIEFLEYIVAQCNNHASVKYVKTMIFKKETIFLLYQALHKQMSYKTAKKYFKPYLYPYQKKPQKIAAIVIETDASLAELLKWKIETRKHIGQRYYSFHINDYYWPETIEAAQAVFCDFKPLDLSR